MSTMLSSTARLRVSMIPAVPSSTICSSADGNVFFAFDLLFLDGEDLRALPLIERKARLKQLQRRKRSPVLYVDHIEARGRQFFDKVLELDLEGIVAKRKT